MIFNLKRSRMLFCNLRRSKKSIYFLLLGLTLKSCDYFCSLLRCFSHNNYFWPSFGWLSFLYSQCWKKINKLMEICLGRCDGTTTVTWCCVIVVIVIWIDFRLLAIAGIGSFLRTMATHFVDMTQATEANKTVTTPPPAPKQYKTTIVDARKSKGREGTATASRIEDIKSTRTAANKLPGAFKLKSILKPTKSGIRATKSSQPPTRSHINKSHIHSKTKSSSVRPRQRRSKRHPRIATDTDRWPYCLVWTPIPLVTWFLPWIGHTGISDSLGIIYDFSDDYNVTIDNFSFGFPTKFYEFDLDWIPNRETAWDQTIKDVSGEYARTMHGLFNNCHEYIAEVLNRVKYGNRTNWSQTEVCWLITWNSSYVDCVGFMKQWFPFLFILILITAVCVVVFYMWLNLEYIG